MSSELLGFMAAVLISVSLAVFFIATAEADEYNGEPVRLNWHHPESRASGQPLHPMELSHYELMIQSPLGVESIELPVMTAYDDTRHYGSGRITVWYWIRAVDEHGNKGQWSEPAVFDAYCCPRTKPGRMALRLPPDT